MASNERDLAGEVRKMVAPVGDGSSRISGRLDLGNHFDQRLGFA